MRLVIVMLTLTGPAVAQTPVRPPQNPLAPTAAQSPQPAAGNGPGDPTVMLPRPETRIRFDKSQLAAYRSATGTWQVISNRRVFRDFGTDMRAADETVQLMRGLTATEWVQIGSPRPVVEYGLVDGRAAEGMLRPKTVVGIDLNSVRVDQLKGVWVVRDDRAVLANFGPALADADQAVAAIKRYGFNRAGQVGHPVPVTTILYHDTAAPPPADSGMPAELVQAAFEANLTRTGVQIPGTDTYTGERIVLDPRNIEIRKEKADYVLASGADVLARFPGNEWAARDALRAVQDGRFTEMCTVGGVRFFLTDGRPPTRVGFGVQSTSFDALSLKVRADGGQFSVMDNSGRRVATAKQEADAELILKLIRAHNFDTVCDTSPNPRASLRFYARTGRR